jgi:hypothetical protein
MKIGGAEHLARMVGTRNTSKSSVEKLERRRTCEILIDVHGWKRENKKLKGILSFRMRGI